MRPQSKRNHAVQKSDGARSRPVRYGGGLHAQKILVGADFATRFDNREYANNDFNESQTLFSARLSPRVGVEWMEKNRLVVGVDMLQNFGQHNGAREPFLSDVKPLMYITMYTKNVQANAGIFDRKELICDFSMFNPFICWNLSKSLLKRYNPFSVPIHSRLLRSSYMQ